jgi:predicted DNA-binding transcriptional regulator AlpA
MGRDVSAHYREVAVTTMRFIRYEDLKPLKGIPFSRPHLLRLQEHPNVEERFPMSADLGENTEAFIEAEVDAYVARRLARREARLAARMQAREERRRAREAAAAAAKPAKSATRAKRREAA